MFELIWNDWMVPRCYDRKRPGVRETAGTSPCRWRSDCATTVHRRSNASDGSCNPNDPPWKPFQFPLLRHSFQSWLKNTFQIIHQLIYLLGQLFFDLLTHKFRPEKPKFWQIFIRKNQNFYKFRQILIRKTKNFTNFDQKKQNFYKFWSEKPKILQILIRKNKIFTNFDLKTEIWQILT